MCCLCECVYCVLSIISGSGSRCGQAKVCQKSLSHTLCTLYCNYMYTCTVFVCLYGTCISMHTSVVLVACFNFSFSVSIYLRIHFL